jgi:hypothetical protein
MYSGNIIFLWHGCELTCVYIYLNIILCVLVSKGRLINQKKYELRAGKKVLPCRCKIMLASIITELKACPENKLCKRDLDF